MNLIMSKILDFESHWTKLLRLCLKISVILKVKNDMKIFIKSNYIVEYKDLKSRNNLLNYKKYFVTY